MNRSTQSRTGAAGVPGDRPYGALYEQIYDRRHHHLQAETEDGSRVGVCMAKTITSVFVLWLLLFLTFFYTYLSLQAQENDHNEETHSPQLRQRHHGYP